MQPAPSRKRSLPFAGLRPSGERFVVVVDCLCAVFTDGADETLGQNAVERGDKVVGFDAHVEEAAQNIDHVVGVDSCEYKMAGERGVMAICAVSWSRISPTRILSGSWRRMERRPRQSEAFFSLTGFA